MIQASKLVSQGQGLASVLRQRATTVELDWEVRQKSRFAATDSAGRDLGIFLPRGTLSSNTGTVVLTNGRNSTATITINITGRTYVQFNMQ